MVHVYRMKYYSAIIRGVSGSEVTRACYTEWSKSERENKYINAFIWNLEKWY